MAFIVTANSKPVYNSFGFSSYWGCNEWVMWHKEMLKTIKQEDADRIWSDAWLAGLSKIGGGFGTAPGSGYVFDSVPIDCRTYNQYFKDYVSKYPILKDTVFSGALGSTVGRVTSTGVGAISSGSDIFDNAAKGINRFSATLKWLIPLLAILLILGASFIVYKKYIEVKSIM